MPTLNQMRNAIDTWVTNRWPTVVARQETYFGNHGHYWQGLRTHLVVPAYTNQIDGSKLGDRLALSPTDQPSSWVDVLPEWVAELLPVTLEIHVYDGPRGKGWVAILEATHNGTLYRRAQNVGPETWMPHAWRQIPAAP